MPPRTTELTLGFDTSGPYCAAALLADGEILSSIHEPMNRGQSERLMGLIEEQLAAQGKGWQDITRIGVGVGPGNFTGIRIGVSAARGLAMSLGVQAVGVSTFEATLLGQPNTVTALVPAPREQAYVYANGNVTLTADWAASETALLQPEPAQLAENIARIAATSDNTQAPVPLYIRPADAAPASDPPPVILDDA
ncbi:tRNA (adenosine(37)-N6)-threonylcarbamoyltransferase complex dimerization subunit type 1 TsaB [Lentibacter algarum]|uniref:tRNA (adenosine(37)-N6)-threonylcarbamoyltransferase complex dimerization subunit type 1 TsaB n=1 Tax=Lentibacter algarum TaxID=576131 RepID=UPI001C0A1B10|nr:tRNA (adenosine(37)-N6)-threonylcarbamoyltransferase complex dimerization subunit type 1 TsaB [Lentibacter algarum]MBU2983512.1 tRNA (adenosine(37)-N6)-threonylcarbamoyltransferase complex dimerization subunit type 1 TsaB [Lentibacter algarum]